MQQLVSNFTLYQESDYNSFISAYPSKINTMEATLFGCDSTKYVSNLDTQLSLIGLQQEVWLISENHKEYGNTLLCSPFTTYITYPMHMMQKFAPWFKLMLWMNSIVLKPIFKFTKINQVVQVNSTMNSLLKHSSQFCKQLSQLTDFLIQHYPKHAILFFRVNEVLDKNLLLRLKEDGYIIFPDRAVHVFNPENFFIKRSATKRDLKLLRESTYEIVQHEALTEQDIDRICDLYHALFIKKHSQHNPRYTRFYFSQAIKNRWHHYIALRNPNGVIDAFISWYIKEKVMVCGPLGYDVDVDINVGLYRMVVAFALQYADKHQYIFNMGAGSDRFKRNRGSQKILEYTAVYCKNLPFYRHIPWRFLQYACNKVLPNIFSSETL